MVKLEDSVLARYKVNENNFEIYVDPYLAWDFKHGKDIRFDDLIAYEAIYSDAKKGEEASENKIKEVFGDLSFNDIVKKIIINGDVQLTTLQKQQLTEKRHNEIIDYLAKNAHDPKAKTPIPKQRLENAFENLKIKHNLNKNKEDEVKEILDGLKKIMPISLDKIILDIKIPANYAGKASSVVYKYDVVSQDWKSDGSFEAKIKIPSGIKSEIISELQNITKANAVVSVLNE